MKRTVDADVIARLEGASLVTVNVFYHFPDYPHLLQTLLWQCLDIVPEYPRVRRFLLYWDRHIIAPHPYRGAHACEARFTR